MVTLYPSLGFSASNLFDSINSNLSSFADTVIKIVQILGIIALVCFGAYSMLSGNLDKVRLGLIIVGIIIISGAKPIVNFFAS